MRPSVQPPVGHLSWNRAAEPPHVFADRSNVEAHLRGGRIALPVRGTQMSRQRFDEITSPTLRDGRSVVDVVGRT